MRSANSNVENIAKSFIEAYRRLLNLQDPMIIVS